MERDPEQQRIAAEVVAELEKLKTFWDARPNQAEFTEDEINQAHVIWSGAMSKAEQLTGPAGEAVRVMVKDLDPKLAEQRRREKLAAGE